MKYDVFISYSSIDRKAAEAICGYLESNGLRCFIDYRDIPPGSMWARVLPSAIHQSGMMLALFSSNYNHSLQVERELSVADKEGMNILPFRLSDEPYEGMKSYYFESLNWIDAFPEPEKFFGSVLEGINAMREQTNNWTTGRRNTSSDLLPEHNAGMYAANVNDVVEALDDTLYDPIYEDDYQDGLDAVRNYDYTEAFELLFDSAMNNYRMAQYYMDRLFNRLGVFRLPVTVWRRILPLAESGNSFAEYLAGRYYYFYIKKDPDMAYEYSARSAKQGNMFGKYDMAKALDLGSSCERNEGAAVDIFKELARNRFPLGMMELGRHYISGFGLRKNPRRGLRYLDEGIQLGFAECKTEKALAIMFADAGTVDIDEARRLLQEAVDDGYLRALSILGDTYLWDYVDMTNVYNTPQNMRRALEIFNQGIRRNDSSSMDRLAFIYSQGPQGLGIAQNNVQALHWYKRSAELGDFNSMCALGRAYYYGELGLNEDNEQAWEWFCKAAYCISSEAQRMLGTMCKDGYGREGKTKVDSVAYFENSIYLGGYSGSLSAEKLYQMYMPEGFDENFPAPPITRKPVEGVDPSLDDTLRVLHAGAKECNPTCCYLLGCALTDTGKPYANEVEGVELLQRAITNQSFPCWSAALRLAELYRKGIGVPADQAEAKRLEELYSEKTGENPETTVSSDSLSSSTSTSSTPQPKQSTVPAEADLTGQPTVNATAEDYLEKGRKMLERMYMSELPDAAYNLRMAVFLGAGEEAEILYTRASQRITTLLDSMARNSNPDTVLLARLVYAHRTPSNFNEVAVDISNTNAWATLQKDWTDLQNDCKELDINVPPLTANLVDDASELIKALLELKKKITNEKLADALRRQPMSKIVDIIDQIDPDSSDTKDMGALTSVLTAYLSLQDAFIIAMNI